MRGTAGALAFLLFRSLRNRLARQLSRLRTPRYAIAAVFGLAYLVLVFGSQALNTTVRPGGVAPALGVLAGLGLAITVLFWWINGRVTQPLVFHPAEVQILFQAPITRRQLIGYKVVRTQVLLLLSCLIWTVLTQSWGARIPAPLRFLTVWGLFSTVSLHHLGAALMQVEPRSGARRLVVGVLRLAAVAGAVALAAAVAPVLLRIGTLGAAEGIKQVGAALGRAPAAWVLAPFRLLVTPLYASSASAWLVPFGMVMAVFGLHLVWVLRMDVPFEESAAGASAEMAARIAAFRERRGGGGVTVKSDKLRKNWLPLAPVGHPAVAIAWKNTLAFARSGTLRLLVILVVGLVATSGAISVLSEEQSRAATVIPPLTLALMTLILGPQMVRSDLRQDLQSLGLIKTWPVSGTALIAAELAAPTLVLTALQVSMLLVAWWLRPEAALGGLDRSMVLAMGILLPFGLLALNAAGVGIQNAAALLFPAWVRLGPDSGGLEAIGQRMLVALGSFLVLALGLVVPAAAGIGLSALLSPSLAAAGLAFGAAVGVLLLAFEVAFLVVMLGELFERTDPSAL